eukprot:gene9729-biopygen11636
MQQHAGFISTATCRLLRRVWAGAAGLVVQQGLSGSSKSCAGAPAAAAAAAATPPPAAAAVGLCSSGSWYSIGRMTSRATLSEALLPHANLDYRDCGLACVLMVLRRLGCTCCDYQQLRKLSQTTSVWTVDLAHLLAHFGATVTFCTITLGINGDFANETFYMEHLEDDQHRVQQLFAQAPQLGISVQERSIPLPELAAAVSSGRQLAVLLVDKRKLDPWQAAADLAWNYTTGVTSATGYTGHYILLTGYDAGSSSGTPAAAAAAGGSELDDWQAVDGASATSGNGLEDDLGVAEAPTFEAGSGSCNSCCSRCEHCGMRDMQGQAAAQQRQQQQQQQQQQQPCSSQYDLQQMSVEMLVEPPHHPAVVEAPAAAAAAQPPPPPPTAAAAAAAPVVLDGFFWVHDPAKTRGPKRVAAAVVEAARKSFGTDEDVLLIDVARGLRTAACPCFSWYNNVTADSSISGQLHPHVSDGSCNGSCNGSRHDNCMLSPVTAAAAAAAAGTAADGCS